MASLGQIIFYTMITLIIVFLSLIILILALTFSGSLSVVQSLNRLPVANLGQDHVLSCFLPTDGEQSTFKRVSVTWEKTSLSGVVFRYEDGAESNGDQDSQYSGRAELFTDAVVKGNASLLLRGVRRADEGEYTCGVSYSDGSGEVSIRLRTAAFTAPTFAFSDGALTAEASRWFPKPNVTWLDVDGNVLRGNTDFQEKSAGMFRVVSTLQPVNDSGTYTCRIHNRLVTAHADATVTGSDISGKTRFTYDAASAPLASYDIIAMCIFCICFLL
ncbi:V-set domain-containing T-cell activation inhibitor 1 [Dunckerocampus dactyliophorus]|uniref:V-set domain-containing T-cell activation inhibitor 1 n=1 Tax=Dunckerocampus dactyliophorus TaxID=161453 RepID=UPI002405EE89|nr:V-set domain-containing T-cell activation inhibitor 1 [Dunckerocampus dactyliophorus]